MWGTSDVIERSMRSIDEDHSTRIARLVAATLIKLLNSIADSNAPAIAADRSTAVVAAAGVKRIDPDH